MAVPFTQKATEALYIHSKELYDLISEQISLIGVLGSKGRIKMITGGLGWRERVFYGTDPNAGHRSRYTQIPTNRLENMTMASYDGAFFSTTIVINDVDRDEVKGDAALGDLVADSWDIAKTYATKKIGEDLWASSQTNSNYPVPLPVFLPATLPASQTGTDRGGINSADNDWWRSQAYTTAISDLGAAAGLRTLEQQIHNCSRSSAKASQPDFGITTSALYTRITSTAEGYRRWTADQRMANLGYESVKFGPLSILWDTQCTAKAFYILNSNKLKIKCLKQPYMQNVSMSDKQLSLPMVIKPFIDDIDTPNTVSMMYLKYQLTANDISGLGMLSNCTE